jgi:hypothetical protein
VPDDLPVRDHRRQQRGDHRREHADPEPVQPRADRHEQRAPERDPQRRHHARRPEAIRELRADPREQLHHRRVLVVPAPRELREIQI